MVAPSSGCDHSSDSLAVERACQIAPFQAVDDLNRAAVFGILHELEYGSLQHYVHQIELNEFVDRNLGNELGVRVLFWVCRVKALFVLDVDHRAGTQGLANQVTSGVRPVRGNAADLWVWLPIGVRR